ncbi:helix-turn-helix domain-containing protein [Nocardia sp. CDC153]|uniref:helix-turn-helix domain-containing protein n=1 Tax=Nocardia sp. CDC153 TaxID=3112167 RepID=UPI002DBFE0FD|nr:helix-turn-helix domain-containing protein [Nocardia sp. CDC153]MEC3952877.1 helix-turn-helix domain-containing protein [Nocardia sp. CDC153]
MTSPRGTDRTPATTLDGIGGRTVARTGFVFGSLTSVATNVLHTFLPTVHMPTGVVLAIAARLGSAIWPIGLVLSIEVLSRVAWRRGPGWSLARFGGAGTVAIGSAVISYSHVRDVLMAWGYGHPAAEVGPLTLDGLMVVCGFALLSLTPQGTTESAGRSAPNPAAPHREPVTARAYPVPQEISFAAQIEALGEPVLPVAGEVARVSGQADTVIPEAVSGEDIETATRRQRAQELHAQGWTHARIATELAVSKRTVRRYLSQGTDTAEDTSGQADTTAATSAATPVTADSSDPFTPNWLTAVETNHHDNHEGVPA